LHGTATESTLSTGPAYTVRRRRLSSITRATLPQGDGSERPAVLDCLETAQVSLGDSEKLKRVAPALRAITITIASSFPL